MFGSDVPSGIEIGIQCETALPTFEQGLRLAIGAVLMSTAGACLTGVSRINERHLRAFGLGLVGDKASQLGKTPAVQPTLLTAFSASDTLANVLEVLQDNGAARRHSINNPLTQNMITVPAEPGLLATEDLQAAFATFGPFGLQVTFPAKQAVLDFFPVALSEKLLVAGDGWAVDAKINANRGVVGFDYWRRRLDNGVQKESSVPLDQISRANPARCRPSENIRQGKGHCNPPCRGGKPDGSVRPVQAKRVDVVAGRAECRMGARRLAFLPVAREGRLQRLCRLDSCLDVQITDKIGQAALQRSVSKVVQGHTVLLIELPTNGTNSVKRLGKLPRCLKQDTSLLGGRRQ